MLKNHQGLAVSTHSSLAVTALDQFVEQCLSYGNQAEFWLHQALAADPDWGFAHAAAAAYYLSQETNSFWPIAQTHLESAEGLLPQANPRETLYIRSTLAWRCGEIATALASLEAITKTYPQDLLAVQQGQYHYFYQGDKYGLLRIAEQVLAVNPQNSYLLGMLAFGLEQCQCLRAAEALGREAVALNPQDVWAQHAVAHVLDSQQRFWEGIAWLEGLSHTWEHCNSLLYTHNWWHLALFYLGVGDCDTALALYDSRVWGGAVKQAAKDQVGAISLLLRLELCSPVNQRANWQEKLSERWQELTPYLLARLHEHRLPFQDLHYILALARVDARDYLQEMLVSIKDHADKLPLPQQSLWLDIVYPVATGLIAYAQADWQQAVDQLRPIISHLYRVGGSRTQRQLFEQIYHHTAAHLHQQPFYPVPAPISVPAQSLAIVQPLGQVA